MSEHLEAREVVYRQRKVFARALIDGRHRSSFPEYRIWTAMIARCNNRGHRSYPSYGGRGIVVCDRWVDDFENFYRDMGARPSPKHSIDRIDNDGPYAPDNCRWATAAVQAKNKRNSETFWTDADRATLIRMFEAYYSHEQMAAVLGRSEGTIRLRCHMLGLKRNGSITRLVKKNQGLRPVLQERGLEAFIAAVSEARTKAESDKKSRLADKKAEKARLIASVMKTQEPRNQKMQALRGRGLTLSEIGRVFSVSRERVRQIEARGFPLSEDAHGSARKIHHTNPGVRRVKIDRLCRAWNAASREARVMFLHAASDFIFTGIDADLVETLNEQRPAPSPSPVEAAE
ncbi:MAG: sigma factor-like helix-turn-helix DNA-binding protein [Flavobacteriaceae bacterium]